MGMTIDEAIRDLVYLKWCGIFPFNYVTDGKQLTIATDECIAVAVDTMRKYQKIEELVTKWSTWNADNHYVSKIREILDHD